MNNNNKNIENYTHKLIKEVGLESPSPLLLENIMTNISLNSSPVRPYRPLISIKTWYLIFSLIITTTILVFTLPIQSNQYLSKLNFAFKFSFTDFIPSISLQTSLIYVGGFFIIFLIQTFYLRNFINRNYQV